MLLFTVCLLSLYVIGLDSTPMENHHRIQRRFMWKSMDETMGAMKSMLGELIPAIQTTAQSIAYSSMDFLPSETTRVKYIIRNPIKPMKLIKIRSPKKVIKIMSSQKHKMEVKPNKPKMHIPNMNDLRKLEKEQEMIAEGKYPAKSDSEKISNKKNEHHTKEHQQPQHKHKENNEVFTGKIYEFGGDWKPVYEGEKKPVAFSTIKPYPISNLHTNIIGEHKPVTPPYELPEYEPPEEYEPPAYEPPPSEWHKYEESKNKNMYEPPKNSYEVTEYAAEESVALPLTQDYRNLRGFAPARRLQSEPKTTSTTSSPSPSTTTTTEEPNYPAAFLRKYRERQAAASSHTPHRFKASETVLDTSWIPSANISSFSHRARPAQLQHSSLRLKSKKWPPAPPPDPPTPGPFVTISSTATIVQQQYEHTTEPIRTTRKSSRLKATLAPSADDAKASEAKRRGRVKFGDKVNLAEFYR